jgi:lysophospholipase L1-like esterase
MDDPKELGRRDRPGHPAPASVRVHAATSAAKETIMKRMSRRAAILKSLTAGAALAGLAATRTGRAEEDASRPGKAAKKDWWDREFRTLVTLGESTTAGGWASTRERCWAQQLARQINEFQRVPVQLINVGIGANLISSRSPAYESSGKPAALERLEAHVIRHRPDLLIVSYGLNDARGGTPLDLFAEEMRTLVDRVRETIQPLIVLLGPYFMTAFDRFGPNFNRATLEIFHQFDRRIQEIAGEKDCLFVDLLSVYGEAPWLIHHDGVHANDLGHRLVANQIFAVLASNCSGLALETKELEQSIPRWRDESVLQQDVRK